MRDRIATFIVVTTVLLATGMAVVGQAPQGQAAAVQARCRECEPIAEELRRLIDRAAAITAERQKAEAQLSLIQSEYEALARELAGLRGGGADSATTADKQQRREILGGMLNRQSAAVRDLQAQERSANGQVQLFTRALEECNARCGTAAAAQPPPVTHLPDEHPIDLFPNGHHYVEAPPVKCEECRQTAEQIAALHDEELRIRAELESLDREIKELEEQGQRDYANAAAGESMVPPELRADQSEQARLLNERSAARYDEIMRRRQRTWLLQDRLDQLLNREILDANQSLDRCNQSCPMPAPTTPPPTPPSTPPAPQLPNTPTTFTNGRLSTTGTAAAPNGPVAPTGQNGTPTRPAAIPVPSNSCPDCAQIQAAIDIAGEQLEEQQETVDALDDELDIARVERDAAEVVRVGQAFAVAQDLLRVRQSTLQQLRARRVDCQRRCALATGAPPPATDPAPPPSPPVTAPRADCPSCQELENRLAAAQARLADLNRRMTTISENLRSLWNRLDHAPESERENLQGQINALRIADIAGVRELGALNDEIERLQRDLAACRRRCATTSAQPRIGVQPPKTEPPPPVTLPPPTPMETRGTSGAPNGPQPPANNQPPSTPTPQVGAQCPDCRKLAADLDQLEAHLAQERALLDSKVLQAALLDEEITSIRRQLGAASPANSALGVELLQKSNNWGAIQEDIREIEDGIKRDRDAVERLRKQLDECNRRCATAANEAPPTVTAPTPLIDSPRTSPAPIVPIDEDCSVPGTCRTAGGPPEINLVDPGPWGKTITIKIVIKLQKKVAELLDNTGGETTVRRSAGGIVVPPIANPDPRSWFNPLGLLARSAREQIDRWNGSVGPRPFLTARDRSVIARYSGGQATGGDGGVHVLLTDRGGSTGKTLALQVLNLSGQTVKLSARPFAIEPIEAAAMKEAQEAFAKLSKVAPTNVDVSGYCIEMLKAPPTVNTIYRLAPRDVQQAIEPMSRVLRSAFRITRDGLLHPDSNVAAYGDSIKQWAIWAVEQKFDERGFTDAFIAHTKKNVEGAGQKWSKASEDTIRQISPNRWRDIAQILRGAGLNAPQ